MSAKPTDHPVLGALLRYWGGKRDGRPMPARQVIDPLEMGPQLLPHLMLCDLFDRGTRVRFRLVGTNVVKRLGFDPTGQYLDATPPGPFVEHLATLHRLLYCERAPFYAESLFRWGNDHSLEARLLLLPLTNGGPDPAIALVGLAFRSAEVFPPQIRALTASGTYEETGRSVVTVPAAPAWPAATGLKIA